MGAQRNGGLRGRDVDCSSNTAVGALRQDYTRCRRDAVDRVIFVPGDLCATSAWTLVPQSGGRLWTVARTQGEIAMNELLC